MKLPDTTINVKYTNYRGETALRRIKPIEVYFSTTMHHLEEQWLLRCFDEDKQEFRSFALKDCDFTNGG